MGFSFLQTKSKIFIFFVKGQGSYIVRIKKGVVGLVLFLKCIFSIYMVYLPPVRWWFQMFL